MFGYALWRYAADIGKAPTVDVIDLDSGSDARRCAWSDTNLYWNEVVHASQDSPTSDMGISAVTLAQCAVVFAGCTTGDAYALKPLVEDDETGAGLRLVTTGAIDRYELRWGSMRIRYLKDDYDHPRWPTSGAAKNVYKAAQRQSRRKILVGGLTAVIEAAFDKLGESAGVVQTWVVRLAEEDDEDLGRWYGLLGVINSATFSRIFVGRYGAVAMSGKQITVKKKDLLEMPMPPILQAGQTDSVGRSVALPSVAEWRNQNSTVPVFRSLIRAAAKLTQRPVQTATFALVDRLAHNLAGALYGRTVEESESDYLWWCARSGSPPCADSLESILGSSVWLSPTDVGV